MPETYSFSTYFHCSCSHLVVGMSDKWRSSKTGLLMKRAFLSQSKDSYCITIFDRCLNEENAAQYESLVTNYGAHNDYF